VRIFKVATGIAINHDEYDHIMSKAWETGSSIFNWKALGIIPANSNGNDINTCRRLVDD